MTIFTNFSGQFAKNDITFFGDFISDYSPFNAAKSAVLGGMSLSNDNSTASLGKSTISFSSTTSGTTFGYAGIYLSPSQTSDGAALTRDFRFGNGEVEIQSRLAVGTVSSAATHMTTFGFSTADYGTSTLPAQNFAGFFALGNASTLSYGVVVDGVASTFSTSIPTKGSFCELRVLVSQKADYVEFHANGKLLRKIQGKLSTTASVLPCVEIKDTTSGGTGIAYSTIVDWMLVRANVLR